MRVKIFGERNSATNALSAMIQHNSSSVLLPGSAQEVNPEAFRHVSIMRSSGIADAACEAEIDNIFKSSSLIHQWKHTATNFEIHETYNDIAFVFIVKNPLSWVYSLFKNPYHQLSARSSSFKEFYNKDWILVGRDNLDITSCKPIELYNHKLRSYMNFIRQLHDHNEKYCLVKFEDFVASQEFVFDQLRDILERPEANFFAIEESTKDKNKNSDYYRDYYGREVWKTEIDPDIMSSVNIDPDLLSFFGYSI